MPKGAFYGDWDPKWGSPDTVDEPRTNIPV